MIEISMNHIAPHIRYVNEIFYELPMVCADRIIYDHEFILPLSGEAIMYLNKKEYILHRGDLFYIKPNQQNQMITHEDCNFNAHCIHFDWFLEDDKFDFDAEHFYLKQKFSNEDLKIIETLKTRPNYEVKELSLIAKLENVNINKLEVLFKELYYTFLSSHSDIVDKLKMKSIFLQIIATILSSQLERKQQNPLHKNTVHDAINYMVKNYKQDLTTTVLAKYFNLSPKYFGALFKEITGITFTDYLLNIRMQNAKMLLTSSNIPIKQIAIQVGIQDIYYFTKLFKKAEAITPAKYRSIFKINN